MEHLMLVIIGILLLIVFMLLAKVYFLRKAAQEIEEAFHDRLTADTNTLIDISTRDPYMRKLAAGINEQLRVLRRQRHKYLSGDKELKEAVTNIAHDLRTPLTAICGYMDLLEREDKNDNTARYLSLIGNRVEAMKLLTEELFRYSVILSTEEMTMERVHVNGVLEESIAAFYGALTGRGIQPQISITEHRIERTLNREALGRVFSNILNNALMVVPKSGDRAVLQWSENFPAENYFKYNLGVDDIASSKSITDSAIQYAETRYFSDFREQMEADGVIPVMPDHPLYHCVVRYNEDGSIFSVTHAWHRRGDTYSDLTITIGHQEVELIQDCITVEVDENGNIVPPSVTVTERDGIQIVAQGNEKQNKTITFQNETAWYQIAGSWDDGYESMVKLLDWVWEHPVDFGMFTMEKGVEITGTSLAEYPDAFIDQIPDFEALGYFLGEHYLQLKDGVPYTFEGHYYTGVNPEQVEDGSYLEMEGWTEIHWCIDAQPDYYALQDCMGDVSELTQERVTDALIEGSNFSFMMDGVFIKVYCKDAAEAWAAIDMLKN